MNKKGQAITDMMYLLIALFGAAVILIIGYQINFEITNQLNDTLADSPNATAALEKGEAAFKITEYWYLFFLIGLAIAAVASAYFIRTHPLFFIAVLLVWIIVLLLAPTLSNVFEELAANSSFDEARTQFGVLTFLAYRIQHYLLFIGALMIIALYAGLKREPY